jgi:TP901 family phage tail tape measure protein
LAEVRQQSYATGIQMAQQYGASLQETLATEADLAAIGKTGKELMASTAQVTRIATLGELDHNTAMQMSISLMSAFKMNANQMGDAFNYINAIENADQPDHAGLRGSDSEGRCGAGCHGCNPTAVRYFDDRHEGRRR